MRNKLIYIGGPTCSGKTKLSILLAETFKTDIISCDSRQIYKETSIGTAKPSNYNLKKVKHHFINHVSIHSDYNVGIYKKETNKVLQSIFKKKKTVILVGGSGLYADSIINGIDDFPKVKSSIMDKINIIFKTEGIDKLNSILKKKDPEYYSIVDKNNGRRVIRALQVCLSTGQTFTSFHKKRNKTNLYNSKILLMDLDRKKLYKKINERVDKMISIGLENEARKLYKHRNLKSLQTVGYSEFFNYFDGKYNYENTIEEIKKNTRRYAKRQITWNKKYQEPFIVTENYLLDEIIEYLNK